MTEVSLTIEYCAFTVATMIERSKQLVHVEKPQYSSAALAELINALPSSSLESFSIDPVALHQGIKIFKKFLTNNGFHTVIMFSESDRIPAYHDLPADGYRGFHLILPEIGCDDSEVRTTESMLKSIAR
jgi:hypothetical protein